MNSWQRHGRQTMALLLGAAGITGRAPARQVERDPAVPRIMTVNTSQPLPSRGRLGGVASDRFGNVFVSNFGATVWRVAPDGEVTPLATDLRGSSGNAVDRVGNLYQASFLDGRIVRIAADGSVSDLVPSGLAGPVGLVIAENGALYVCACQSNSIVLVAPDGSSSDFARHPDLDCPNGITVGHDGAMYVVSFNNGHVVRVDAAGDASRFATVPESRNAHIAYAAGAFWITKIETHTVYRLTTDGRVDRYAGAGTPGFDDGPVGEATLAHPNGIAALPGGRGLVVNTLEGEWRGDSETRIVLRRIQLPPPEPRPEHITIPVGDLVFDALAAGPNDGELVLLLHGFPQTGDAFREQLRALGAAGYRAVAPDQRGYSPGARPAGAEAYAMGNLVADAMGMADALGHDRFHLVGHDWGGAVAWVASTRHPDRIRTLTVLSTPHFAAFGAQLADPESEQSRRSSYFSDFARPDAADRLLANDMGLLREILSGMPSSHRDVYLTRLGSREPLQAALNWYRASAPRPSPSGGQRGNPATASAPPISVPTLYIWGTEDGAFGRAAVEATAGFVTGPYDFHALEGVGHWVPETAADTVNHLLLRHLRERGAQEPSLENYERAHRALRRAREALGGAAVTSFENLEAGYRAQGLARGQSRAPGPPFDSTQSSGRFLYEHRGRLYHEEQFVNEGGTDRSFSRALLDVGSWNYWIARALLTPVEPSDVALLRSNPTLNMEKALPHSLVRAALDNPASLRWLGERHEDGRRVEQIVFAEPDGEMETLGIDAETGYPVFIERLGSDRLAGDAVHGVRFRDYAGVDGLAVPRRLDFTLNGDVVQRWRLSGLRVNQAVDDARFAPPGGVAYAEHPPRFAPIQVAPGVHMVRLYSGPANSYNTMLVEFADHVVVLEAPLVDAFYPVFQQIAKAVAPGKPIRSVVTTHHHHDHSGGVRRFLAEGVDVLAPPHAVAVIRAMAGARHTISSTAAPTGNTGRLIPVADSVVLSDGSRTIRLLQVGPTPHAEQILVAHLPEAQVLFVADLFAVPETRVFPPASATFRHFAELVERFDLQFQTVVPTHGVVGTATDLRTAVSGARPSG